MQGITTWTGSKADALRRALRMTNEAFAHDLGIVVRTVAYWRERPDTIPQPAAQEALDAALERAPERAKAQFARLINEDDQTDSTDKQGAGVNYLRHESDEVVAESHREWLNVRRNLGRNRAELTRIVSQLYPRSDRLADTGILMPDQWRLPVPVDLAAVNLVWRHGIAAPEVNGQHAETRPLRPLASRQKHYTRYHRAMHDLDRPRLFENRLCYRLANVNKNIQGRRVSLDLTLGNMCYFDMIDVGEALAHEAALAGVSVDGKVQPEHITWEQLPFRRMIQDPFDLASYPLMLSISTLTIRKSHAGTTFLLLRRNPAKVAIAGGMLSVYPTGVFQPASIVPAPNSPDFDLWRNIMREYRNI
jgi:hypothetical protein